MPALDSAPLQRLDETVLRAASRVRVFTFPRALIALLAVQVFLTIRKRVDDPDIWWHLRNAEYLVSNHRIPDKDLYSYTVAGSPWISHQWLAELIYYAGFRLGGLAGVFSVFLLVSLAVILGIFFVATRRGHDVKNAFVATVFATLMATVSLGPRTLLFGWLCMVALYALLDAIRSRHAAPWWAIPAVFLLWVNFHGSWIIGLITMAVTFACGLLRGRWGVIYSDGWARPHWRRLTGISLASIAVLFIHPVGYRIVTYPFDLFFKQSFVTGSIEEWGSVDFHTDRGKLQLVFLLILFLMALLSRHHWRVEDVVFLLIACYLSLTHVRFQFFAAIIAAPILAERIKLLPPLDEARDKPWLNLAIITTAIVLFAALFPTSRAIEQRINTVYPSKALAYMEASGIRDRVYHDYVWGGYMIWYTRDIPVFIDGRSDIFDSSGVFRDYLESSVLQRTYEIFDQYDIHSVLVPPTSAVAYLLNHGKGWKVRYQDQTAVLFQRENSRPVERASVTDAAK